MIDFISELYVPIVIAGCLVLGYIMKYFLPTNNKFIPIVLAVAGAIIACVYGHTCNIETIIAGAVSGLASTGFHQAFKQLITNDALESEDK